MGNEEKPGHVERLERQRLLRKVAAWYHQTFQDDPKGREALGVRGLTDVSLFMDFRIGFCNGTLKQTAPPRSGLRAMLKEAGVINGEGKEFFEGCLVFPWFEEGDECAGMWGLSLETGRVNTYRALWEGPTTSRRSSAAVPSS